MAPLRLRERLDDDPVVDDAHLARDRCRAGVEVDVLPAEPEPFASPATGGGEEHPRWEVAAIGDKVEKAVELVCGPRFDVRGSGGGLGRGSRCVCDVATHPTPAHGVAQRNVEDAVDVFDHSGCQSRLAFVPRRCGWPLR